MSGANSSAPDEVGAFVKRAMRRHEAERASRDVSTGHDFLLGHVAVEWKLVTPETLLDCLREQQERRAKGEETELGDVLRRRKLVDDTGLAKLMRECASRAQRSGLSKRFEVLERLGEGAMAVVYRAVDRSMGRDVALKLMRLPLEGHEGARARFTREAHAAGALAHPNVVRIYDAGQDEGRTYLVMELVDGRPMSAEFCSAPKGGATQNEFGARPRRELVAMLEGAARGVQAAHAAGIVHRDLKPGNILVARDGTAKVADFGLAYVQNSALTQSGAQMGTPLYMSPEQVRGGEITPATDVYALGAILYEILTGRPPFIGVSIAEIYARIQSEDAPRPGSVAGAVPADLEAVALKAIAKEPSKRYPSAAAFADDLGRHLRGEPVLAKPEGAVARAHRKLARHRAVLVAAVFGALLVVAAVVLVVRAVERAGRFDALRAEARALEVAGDLRAAEQAWLRALELRPGDADGVNGAERCRMRQRDAELLVSDAGPLVAEVILSLHREDVPVPVVRARAEEVRERLRRAIATAPRLVDAHLQMGRVLEVLGDRAGAEAALRRAEELEPASQAVQGALGRLLVESAYRSTLASTVTGRPEAGEEQRRALAAEAARCLERAAGGRDGAVEDWIRRALLAYALGRLDEAAWIGRQGIERCSGREPGVETLHWIVGVTTTGEASVKALSEALALKPRYALALESRGSARMVSGDLAGADADYTRALELMPGSEPSLVNRGSVRFQMGRFAEAEADFTAAIGVAPNRAGSHLNRAMARLALDRDREALDDLDRAIELHPTYAIAYGHRARARYELGNSAAAVDDANAALRLDPDVSIALTVRGTVAFDGGEMEAAKRDLDRAVEIDPRNLVARRIRARLCGRLQEWASVRADLDVVLGVQRDPEMFLMRAFARLGLGDAEGSEADCTESLRLKPGQADGLGLRAMAREQLRDAKGAVEDAKAALEGGMTGAKAEMLRRLIERMKEDLKPKD